MRKISIYLISAILLLTAVGLMGKKKEEPKPQPQPEVSAVGETDVTAEMTNTTKEYGTITEAAEAVPFDINIPPGLKREYAQGTVLVIDETIVEVHYYGTDNKVICRTGYGLGNISGDYTFYKEERKIKCDDIEIIVKGDYGLVSLAYFSLGQVKCSLSFSNTVTDGEVLNIVGGIKEAPPGYY